MPARPGAASGRRRNGSHGREAAALPLTTIGEEEVEPAGRAEPRVLDPGRRHTGGAELVLVGLPQVEHPLPRSDGGDPGPPRTRKARPEALDHGEIHLV